MEKISVVIPTYNGERFFEEQLNSILNQTQKPDEIIISDDGSTDGTLSIAEKYKNIAKQNGIEFIILTDNSNHGWIKNYEWATRHATGDYIFNCDQDDVWTEDKIEKVISEFHKHPNALCIAHNIDHIDANGVSLGQSDFLDRISLPVSEDECCKLETDLFLKKAVSSPLFNCMSTCISKNLIKYIVPFHNYLAVDQWEIFTSFCYGEMYFKNTVLTHYRLHDSNVTYSDPTMGFVRKVKRIFVKLKNAGFSNYEYYSGIAMLKTLKDCNLENTPAYTEARERKELGDLEKEIVESSRFVGVYKLLKLFFTNTRFRKKDPKNLPYELCAILRGRVDRE